MGGPIIFKSTILLKSSNNNDLVKDDYNGHKYIINNDLTTQVFFIFLNNTKSEIIFVHINGPCGVVTGKP